MKQIINTLKGTVVLALISFSAVKGQDVAANTNKFSNPNNLPDTEVANKVSAPAVAANISQRAIRDFAKTYKSNVQPIWSQMDNGGFTASYVDADIQNCVCYDKKGNWTCDIKRYDESKMSPDIRKMIKPVYYDYKINGITEITLAGKVVHLVYLAEDAKNFKTVRIFDGEMDVIEWIKDGEIMKL